MATYQTASPYNTLMLQFADRLGQVMERRQRNKLAEEEMAVRRGSQDIARKRTDLMERDLQGKEARETRNYRDRLLLEVAPRLINGNLMDREGVIKTLRGLVGDDKIAIGIISDPAFIKSIDSQIDRRNKLFKREEDKFTSQLGLSEAQRKNLESLPLDRRARMILDWRDKQKQWEFAEERLKQSGAAQKDISAYRKGMFELEKGKLMLETAVAAAKAGKLSRDKLREAYEDYVDKVDKAAQHGKSLVKAKVWDQSDADAWVRSERQFGLDALSDATGMSPEQLKRYTPGEATEDNPGFIKRSGATIGDVGLTGLGSALSGFSALGRLLSKPPEGVDLTNPEYSKRGIYGPEDPIGYAGEWLKRAGEATGERGVDPTPPPETFQGVPRAFMQTMEMRNPRSLNSLNSFNDVLDYFGGVHLDMQNQNPE